MNAILSLNDCMGTFRGGGDDQTLPAVIKNKRMFALTGGGDAKTSPLQMLTPKPPGETFTIFSGYDLYSVFKYLIGWS